MEKHQIKEMVDRFGITVQINKIQEEAIELALAISHLNCPTKNHSESFDNVHKELADMEIMLEQARYIFDSNMIDYYKKQKIKRFNDLYL